MHGLGMSIFAVETHCVERNVKSIIILRTEKQEE